MVASAVGCTPAYISQLLSEEAFATEVATLRCADITSLKERDDKYDALEDQLLRKLSDIVPMMFRPREIIHALATINNAKRRAAELVSGGANSPITINQTVVLQLPSKTVNTFELNKHNEIISIDDQPLVGMPSSALLAELKAKEKKNVLLPNPTPATDARSSASGNVPAEILRRQERVINEDSV